MGRGLIPLGVGLMAAGAYVLARSSAPSAGGVMLAVVVGIMVQSKIMNSALAIILAGAAGVAFNL